MKKILLILVQSILVITLLCGCATDRAISLEELCQEYNGASEQTIGENPGEELGKKTEEKTGANLGDNSVENSSDKADVDVCEKKQGASAATDAEEGSGGDCGLPERPSFVYVYVCGSVEKPGVYKLSDSCRIVDALDAAGGFLEDAEIDYVNLAAELFDGMQIYFPSKKEMADWEKDMAKGKPAEIRSYAIGEDDWSKGKGGSSNTGALEERGDNAKVNINQASLSELCSLPGIGESKAKAMISYREENGGFQAVEDIQKVPGIGAATYKNLKDLITV